MNILGTITILDEPHIDLLKYSLMTNPPPTSGNIPVGTVLCMDMDDADNMIEMWFPDHALKATLLCPPPNAMCKEIDGDEEGFIQAYNEYLEYDDSVQDFISSMLLLLHTGGNIILYSPSYISDCPIWLNTLMLFFFTRYGITIGTSAENGPAYDTRYDSVIATALYRRGYMNVFDFIYSNGCDNPLLLPGDIRDRLWHDLLPMCTPNEENPDMLYCLMLNTFLATGVPTTRPAIWFT